MIRSISEICRFLGRRTVRLLVLSIVIGLYLFVVDLVFAYTMHALLVGMGVIEAAASRLPSWCETVSFSRVLAATIFIGTLRAAGNWVQVYLKGAAADEAKFRHRAELVRRSFGSTSASASETASLFTAYTDALGSAVGSLQSICLQATFLVFMGAGLAFISPAMTAVLVAVLLAWSLLLRGIGRKLLDLGEGLKQHWSKLNRRLLSGIRNLLFLHAHGMEQSEADRAQEDLVGYHRNFLSFHFLGGLKVGANQMLALVMLCSIALVERSSHRLPAGLLVTYIYLLIRFLQSFALVHAASSNLHLCYAQTRSLYLWWTRASGSREAVATAGPPEIRNSDESSPPLSERPGWKLSGVDFSYHDSVDPLFSALDLEIKPGQTLVITGASGSGKTTLINLLLGTLCPDRGKIELLLGDGAGTAVELPRVREQLLQSVGFVGPESFLIEGSIRNNLFYGLARVPDREEVVAALDRASCAFVGDLPGGLNHQLDDQGQGLSAGEKQRLCLARALLRRPKVLILDEPTAHLDSETEARILETLASLKGGTTIVAATHRSSLLSVADTQLELPQATPP